ncbi:chromate transporter [Gottfriedia sp. NPDC056225]|uniref:chromate transporter n=1 Tax=Gottfriedia sp. NPDC056225 TaxID=3345751 RepID=UPI0035E37295
MFWQLFWTFFKIGLISFGGGYAMLPVMERESSFHGWMTIQEFTNAVAIAGMSPGSIAINSAIFVGYRTAGLTGAVITTCGILFPSLISILILATVFFRFHKHKLVKSAFYGLRPVTTGLIIYSAIRFSLSNNMISHLSWYTLSLILIFAISLFSLFRLKIHPICIILFSGLIGILIYS